MPLTSAAFILAMTMKMALVLLVLCSGFPYFTFASNRLRFFNRSVEKASFNDSLTKCKEMEDSSLVTLYDEDDAKFTYNFMQLHESDDNQVWWLGLIKSQKNVTTWSDGTPITPEDVKVTNRKQICGAIENKTKTSFNCSERRSFMCYKDNNYTLIEHETKNWCQALQYCRRYFTDLVSISNDAENELVIEEGKNNSFWIGLLHDEWEWMDRSCSTFREWATQENLDEKLDNICGSQKWNLLYKFGCESEAMTLCSKGTVRIKVINESLTWEQAFDYCNANHTGQLWIRDEKDQVAVEQWLTNVDYDGPFWIGLRQSRVFGFWIWRDTKVVFSNWNGKQPELPFSSYCGVINKDGTWSVENCWRPLPFICEEEIFLMKK